ncbi:MAG: hypothetical protein PWQ37_3019 [Candidatus Petromonas sp.]|jgi:uncharacterized protein YebE (UPF0316 family)|nr:hypothetical protein [Candidatus Petromonas sp.]
MDILVYVFIFCAKLIEVTLYTFRTLMIMRGNPSAAGIIGFFEVMIWITALGKVMTSLNDPAGIIVYAAGFGIGNYLGGKLEEKIGIGLLKAQIIIEKKDDKLGDMLREKGYGVTSVEGRGRDSHKEVLIVMLRRKELNNLKDIIWENDIRAVVTVQDVKKMHGGFMGMSARKLRIAG